MAEQFYSILTLIGIAAEAAAKAAGSGLLLTNMAVGDGNGNYYEPSEGQTALVNEKYRAGISSLTTDPNNVGWVIAEMTIPASSGGWWVREVGIFTSTGNLYAVGKIPATYKPLFSEGAGKDLVIRLIFETSNANIVTLMADPSVVLPSKAYVDSQDTAHNVSETAHENLRTTAAIGAMINGATEKTTPVNADMVGLMDSAAANIFKKLSWANIKATLKTYFDSLYLIANQGITATVAQLNYTVGVTSSIQTQLNAKAPLASPTLTGTPAAPTATTGTNTTQIATTAFVSSQIASSAPAETTNTMGTLINGATAKATPVDADMIGLMDSAASNILKKLSWANIKATLKAYIDTINYASSTGSANAYVLAPSPALTAHVVGLPITFKANFTNTGAATINISGLGVVPIKKNVSVALVAGDIVTGQMVEVQYDGTNYQLINNGQAVDLSQFASSLLAAGGWKKFPDINSPTGYFILQWGTAAVSSATAFQSFARPTAYPNAVLIDVVCDLTGVAGQVNPVAVGSGGTTAQIQLCGDGTVAPQVVNYLSIGY